MFIDVHCHIEEYRDIKEIMERAKEAGVEIIVNNSIDLKSIKKSLSLREWFPNVKIALGVYPIEVLKLSDSEIKEIIGLINKNKKKIIAIGEVGIDLKWSQDIKRQREIFEKFIEVALLLDLPLIVHSRKAEEEVIDALEKKKCKKVVMHCFSGSISLVERIVKNGWMISIPTSIVFSDSFKNIVKKVPLKNLLCETDSPHFHPFGKRRNEPCFVVESYRKIAEIKNLEIEDIEESIEENFHKLFG